MPGETIDEMTEQQVSTVEEDSLKQSKPDLSNNDFPEYVPNESTSIPPQNELTNGLKRSLPDKVESDKKKKIRLEDSENEDENELKVTSKNDNGIDHIETLIERVDQIAGNLKNTIVKSNVSNETNVSFKMLNHDNSGIDDKDCKEDSPDKNNLSVDISKDIENKTTDTSSINNNCEFIGNSEATEKNCNNKLVENDIITSKGISDLNRPSSSEKLVVIENNEHENETVINDFSVTENIVKDSTVTECNLNYSNNKISGIENIVNSKKNGIKLLPVLENSAQSLIKNTEDTKTVESHPCDNNTIANTEVDVHINCNNHDYEVIDSDTSSDISSSDIPDLPENLNEIITGVHQISKESFPQLLKLFSKKQVTYDQFDSLCTQKIIEIMTERLYWGKDRYELQLLKEREKHWRTKYYSLNRQFKEIKTIVNIHKLDLKTNEYAKPHVITRTVGLQAVLCPKKEGSMKLPKLSIPLSKPVNGSVSIISDDEDDVISLNKVDSAKASTSKSQNSTPKKQKSPLTTKSNSPVVSPPKTVPAAKSLDSVNIDTATIDLTGNDDGIEVSNLINLEEPISVLHHQSPGILPAQLNNNLPKTITYVELPTHPTSSSSFIMRTASGSPKRTTVSNKDTINTSDPKSMNLKPYIIDVSRVDPVLVQPCTVTYTTQRVPASQISGTLQPMSTAPYTPRQISMSQLSASLKPLTTAYTTCQLPVSHISGSLPQTSPGTSFTACRLPISIHAIPPLTSTEHPLTGSRPPPPAIPILEHPAPLPPIPNQRSLTSWKKLPPAPKVSVSKTVESQIPQALVVSWNMSLNKTIAQIANYQIFAYQEVPNQTPHVDLWKRVGEVNALPLPMACSLTQFANGEKYHFTVRAVDIHTRVGPFSIPQSII